MFDRYYYAARKQRAKDNGTASWGGAAGAASWGSALWAASCHGGAHVVAQAMQGWGAAHAPPRWSDWQAASLGGAWPQYGAQLAAQQQQKHRLEAEKMPAKITATADLKPPELHQTLNDLETQKLHRQDQQQQANHVLQQQAVNNAQKPADRSRTPRPKIALAPRPRSKKPLPKIASAPKVSAATQAGWEKHFSDEYQLPYWWNSDNCESVWEEPDDA